MTDIKTSVTDALKFASTVGVWYLLQLIFPNFSGPWADAATQIFTALLAGGLVVAVREIVLGGPTLRVEWAAGGRAIPDKCPDLRVPFGEKMALHANVIMEGRSLLARGLMARSRRTPLELTLSLRPPTTARCVRQGGSGRVRNSVVTFDLSAGLRVGINSDIEFSVTPSHNTIMQSRIDCDMQLRAQTGHHFRLLRLIDLDSGIDGFVIGGIRA